MYLRKNYLFLFPTSTSNILFLLCLVKNILKQFVAKKFKVKEFIFQDTPLVAKIFNRQQNI